MKKFNVILILFLFILSGCKQDKKINEQEMIIPAKQDENVQPAVNQENEATRSEMDLNSCAGLIGMTKQEVTGKLGNQYEVRSMGRSNLDQGYYYNKLGIAFFFNGDQRLQYIECQGGVQFFDKELSGDLNSVKKVIEKSKTVTEETLEYLSDGGVRECYPENKNCVELSYFESDYLVVLVSADEAGRDFSIYIYKPIGFLDSEEIVDLLDYDTEQIQKRFGMDCIQSGPYEELFPSWNYYQALGLYFGTNYDYMEERNYIQFAPWIEFDAIHAGLNFEEVQQKLGDSLIIKESRYMIGCIVYTIEYRKEDYFLSLESDDIIGNDSMMQIGKISPGYRDRINPEVEWNFHEDTLGFVYRGEEYSLNLEDVGSIVPIYDSCEYEQLQISEEALGAGCYLGGYTGSVESFYVAFDSNGELNLYVRRYMDSSNKDEPYSKEQVISTDYRMVHCKDNGEMLLINASEDELQWMNGRFQDLQMCLYINSISSDDVMESKALKKEVKYDFNMDGEIDTLQVSCSFNQHIENNSTQYYDTVVELSIGNSTKTIQLDYGQYDSFMVGICDVDLSDDFVEIYTTEFSDCYGISSLFRMKGDELEKAVDLGYNKIVGVSGDGKVYVWDGCYRYTQVGESYEDLVLWYIDYESGKTISTNQIIGKQYSVSYQDILFHDLEDVPCGPPVEVSMKLEGAFYEPLDGEILTIIDKNDSYQALKVRTKDGKEGWIGGYHMVWN